MKKLILFAAGLAVAVALTPQAFAQNKAFESSVVQTGDLAAVVSAEGVSQRYYSPTKPDVGRACSTGCGLNGVNCALAGFDGQDICKLTYNAKLANGYRGYGEDIGNYGAAEGTTFYSIFDAEKNAGAANHQGFYSWTAGPVLPGDSSTWNASSGDCVGTTVASCLGNGNTANSKNQVNVPASSGATAGTISKLGGLSPIPVPKAADLDGDGNAGSVGGVKGFYELSWDAVTSVGKTAGLAAAGYQLNVAKTTGSAGTCPAPTAAQFTLLKTVATNSATVTAAEVGAAATDCVTFALRIVYPGTSDGKVIRSRYLSANGQSFQGSGLAATIYDLSAKFVGKNNTEVSWKTSLEDGVKGFYVTRSLTQNGTFERVSSLIAAKGEASAYSFVDTVTVQTPARASGVWYKVETVDMDDATTAYGPAKTSVSADRNQIIRQRTGKSRR